MWVVSIAIARTLAAFFASAEPGPSTIRTGVLLTLGEAVLIGLPIGLLAAIWRQPRYRAVFRAWGIALVFLILMLPAGLPPIKYSQLQSVLQILIALVYTAFVRWLGGRQGKQAQANPNGQARPAGGLGFAVLAVAALLALPWLAWGALGSPLDSLLSLAAALSIGLAAGQLLETALFAPFRQLSAGGWRDIILVGFAASTALVILASGTGFVFGSMQLLLILVLPSLGIALAGLSRAGARVGVLSVFIGFTLASPMALIDPDELALIISASPGEILIWALRAAGISLLTGLAFSLIVFLITILRKDETTAGPATSPGWSSPLFALLAGVGWVVAVLVYFLSGQPGFYGERLFVILKSQPDLSSAAGMQDYNARRSFVYTTLVDNANATQAGLRQALDSFHIAYTPYYLENSLEIQADPILRLWLATRPEVDRVLDSPHMRPLPQEPASMGGNSSAPSQPDWNLTLIGADRVWNELNITGQGIVVGQSDSGVDGQHPDLAPSYRGKSEGDDYNWLDPWYGSRSPTDAGFHGTHTLGIIVGKSTGVAPGASWIGCVNLARNLGNPALYLNCMQFMLAPYPQDGDPLKEGDPSRGANVINDSWGCPDMEGCDTNALLVATQALRAAGVFVESSAGNDGPACETIRDPISLYASVYTTGAINQFGQLASFSSRGPVTADGSGRIKPDIVAPGVDVLSTLPGDTYGRFSGTSMSGPHVVGVVALMWSANPALIGNIDRTEQILDQTAKPYTGTLPDCPQSNGSPSSAVGYGVVDAYAAVKMAQQEGR
jgi:hypothetical protein